MKNKHDFFCVIRNSYDFLFISKHFKNYSMQNFPSQAFLSCKNYKFSFNSYRRTIESKTKIMNLK